MTAIDRAAESTTRCFGGKWHEYGPFAWSPLYHAYVKVCSRCGRVAGRGQR